MKTHIALHYGIPDPYDTQEQHHQFYHLDLPSKSTSDLECEHNRLKSLICLLPDAYANPWYSERFESLENEIQRRRTLHRSPHLSSPRDQVEHRPTDTVAGVDRPSPGRSGPPLSDYEITRRMLSAKNGLELRALWRSDIRAYHSYNDAKTKLLNTLTWWCQGDATQADRLFRQSGLYRQHHGTA